MDIYEELKDKLGEYGYSERFSSIEDVIECHMTFRQVCEELIQIGTILEGIEYQKIFVVSIKAGFGAINNAVFAVKLQNKKLYMVGYAKEGLLSQKTCAKAVKKINRLFTLEPEVHTKRSLFQKMIIGVVGLVIVVIFFFAVEGYLTVEATKKYNVVVQEYNRVYEDYSECLKYTCIDNVEGLALDVGVLSTESENISDAIKIIFSKNSRNKIEKDTSTVKGLIDELEKTSLILKQITVPSENWVMERLEKLDTITGVQAVTEEKNPDGLLNQEGGYVACVYFTIENIDPNTIKGTDIVAKGTDAGGAIEVYKSVEEAETRCEYLSEFDGTVLYSGSYAIVGTMVIRTSYILSDVEQYDLTSEITQVFTALY